jgi:hypothetical protein
MYTGSCLCNAVQFRIDAALEPVQVCHCSQCRKAQGGPFATNIPVPSAAFQLVCGDDRLSEYESSPGKKRVFCSRCGSPVFSRRDSHPGVVRVRAGLIDEALPAGPGTHFHVASKCNWWTIRDDAPQFAAGYVRDQAAAAHHAATAAPPAGKTARSRL